MAGYLDVCRYTPTAGGTTDWTFSAAVLGYQSPAAAGVINGTIYRYRAESADLTQWEIGFGAYTTGTGVLARTTVLFNSSATGTGAGQSGAGTKINFTTTPQVAIVALAEDLAPMLVNSNNLSDVSSVATARTNLGAVNIAGDTMTGALTVTVANQGFVANGANSSLELGATSGANTPFIDFHSSGNANDYDVRMLASGGSASIGLGALTITADVVSLTGKLFSIAKGHQLGSPGGTAATGAVASTDANILLYNNSSVNWAGVGVDTNGIMWFRTGLSGTPVPAMYLDTSRNAFFNANVTVNATLVATDLTIFRTGAGGASIVLSGDGATTPNKIIRASLGVLDFINSANTTVIASLTDAGDLSWLGSAWTAYTPTATASVGVFGSIAATGKYKKYGKVVHFQITITITTLGTASGSVLVTLPPFAASGTFAACGRENQVAGYALTSTLQTASTTTILIQKYDATFAGAAGNVLVVSGTYEAA